MKILALNGSPKAKSDTFRLAEAFLEGVTRYGNHKAHVIHVIEKKIAPCTGCFGCWKNGDDRCVIEDDLNPILEEMLASDMVLWNFPIYACGMPGHLKILLDRTLPISKREEDGRGNLCAKVRIRKTMFISGCGAPTADGVFNSVRQTFAEKFGRSLGICVPQTPILNTAETAEAAEKTLARFRAAGDEFSFFGTLSKRTVDELEKPPLPPAEYIAAYKRWYKNL